MYPAPLDQFSRPKIRPIVKPGASRWALALTTSSSAQLADWRSWAAAGGALATLGVPAAVAAADPNNLGLSMGLLVAWTVAFVAVAVRGSRIASRQIVGGWRPLFEGVPVEGEALDLLADIQQRFDWAERMFGQVPTGIRWDEVEDQVAVLMWESAEQAAKVSALDVEIGGLVYANPGTPQAALRKDLQRIRAETMALLHQIQREADALAREASNTAAAARVALARTGSVYDLEVASPSGANLVARGTLAAARARLALLAEVWGELDETAALAWERVEAAQGELDAAATAPRASRRRRRSG